MFKILPLIMVAFGFAPGVWAQNAALTSSLGSLTVERVAQGFDTPWAFEIMPDGALLVTERDGLLWHLAEGKRNKVRGVPRVVASGQGGLLDVTLAQDFERSRRLYLTYSKPQNRGSGTALATARLSRDGRKLEGVETLFESAAGGRTGRHFGSRVVQARDGTLFVTIGDRGDRPSAQDRSNHNGSIIRIHPDGSVPRDNPFVDVEGVRPEIWSYGHRNPQGAGLDARGQLWTAEHGARGGDEVNKIRKGANFGWPVISYGRHYTGGKIGIGTQAQGMEQPHHYWDPSIAPSGLMIYSGAMFPEWRGDMFVGSLKLDHISRLKVSGKQVREVERLSASQTERVRDIQQGPKGAIWYLSASEGAIYKISRE